MAGACFAPDEAGALGLGHAQRPKIMLETIDTVPTAMMTVCGAIESPTKSPRLLTRKTTNPKIHLGFLTIGRRRCAGRLPS